MKKLIEALKKEAQMEYLMVLTATFIYLYFVYSEALGPFIGSSFVIMMGIIPDPYFPILISICIATILAVPIYFIARRDENVLDLTQKDERELQHEYAISHTGYRVLVTLIGIYWFWFDMLNPWLLGIIAMTLLFRLGHRLILEYKG